MSGQVVKFSWGLWACEATVSRDGAGYYRGRYVVDDVGLSIGGGDYYGMDALGFPEVIWDDVAEIAIKAFEEQKGRMA